MLIDRLRSQAVDLWNAAFILSVAYPVHRRRMPARSRRQQSACRFSFITERAYPNSADDAPKHRHVKLADTLNLMPGFRRRMFH
ncbi:hypothetical protein LGN19_13960 [Burkholderia sp. AU30198]|uniref:hypothetical protein n=1 Tax=Burkholderia sp. AU30198 TaxID=2879627 RepID=UPI001CF18162|nr:hypothetical protein [Burkholderia sp. AU30198]MCA8294897.1 hypothetical protein [Burkholderia sp. AU30198]